MTQLEPCPHCARHVKVTEAACPFCARSLADAFTTRAPRIAPRARLGRAATFAFGVLAMSACGDNEKRIPSQDAATDAPPDAGPPMDDGGGVPIYAAAPTKDGGTTPSRG